MDQVANMDMGVTTTGPHVREVNPNAFATS